jgi:hypothetical protein
MKNSTGQLNALLHQLQTEMPIGVHYVWVKPTPVIFN